VAASGVRGAASTASTSSAARASAGSATASAARAAPSTGAAAGSAPASSAAAAVAPAAPASAANGAAFAALIRNDMDAWRELAPLWRLPVGDGDPCQAAQRSEVLCFKSNPSLALIRQLGRPGILTLRGNDDKVGYALLTGLTGQSAVLRSQGAAYTVSLESLAGRWRGEFATYWKAPAGYRARVAEGDAGPVVDDLAARLAKLQNEPAPPAKRPFDAALKAKVYAFQFAQELKPDGVAGPETFMLLNRATGVDEPRLQTEE
jgi:general secretion pathway protein A